MDKFLKIAISISGAGLSYAYGGWTMLLQVLVALTIADYVTGFIAAAVEGKLNSKVGWKGAIKKITIFVVIAVAHQVDMIMGNASMVQDAATIFYISNECLSVLENAGRANVPIPAPLRRAVEVLQNKNKGDDQNGPGL